MEEASMRLKNAKNEGANDSDNALHALTAS